MTNQDRDSSHLPLFAVIRTRGPAWNHAKPIEGQQEWEAHRVFMNALEDSGFVLLGGPLEGTNEALLIVRAGGPEEITTRLAAYPWTAGDLLRTSRVTPWTLRLGRLP